MSWHAVRSPFDEVERKPVPPPPPKPRDCVATRRVEWARDPNLRTLALRACCNKREGHDDPMAEVGGVRRDPTHSDTFTTPDGVTVEISWPSERTT